jgi:sialic acid synthase SpsE
MSKTFVIAEAGANHNKNFNQALSLIDVAIKSGADACKFQTYSADTLYSKNTPDFAGYKNINNLIKEIELPREWQKDLKTYCDENGIEFMSTPFDEKAVDELVNLGVKRLKIAGFESTDFRFVDMVASTGLPLIISLGIGFDLDKHLNSILNIQSKYNNNLTLLHCNNAYPTPMHDANLNMITYIKEKIWEMNISLSKSCIYNVGFSDHTQSILTPSLAVVKGATVIEKHFTLSKHLPGPDHPFAIEPNELKEMITLIRNTESTLSNTYDGVFTESEKQFKNAMRSVVAKKDIKFGEIFTKDNITTKRPFLEGNVRASEFEKLLGKPSNNNYSIDDFIK